MADTQDKIELANLASSIGNLMDRVQEFRNDVRDSMEALQGEVYGLRQDLQNEKISKARSDAVIADLERRLSLVERHLDDVRMSSAKSLGAGVGGGAVIATLVEVARHLVGQ